MPYIIVLALKKSQIYGYGRISFSKISCCHTIFIGFTMTDLFVAEGIADPN